MITVASYNIRKGLGTDRRRRPDRILDVLHEVSADVVALQEADRRFGARQSALPSDLIARGEYKAVPFDIRPGGIGWHGNAILVRHSVDILDYVPLDLPRLEPRGAVLAELSIGGKALRIVGMHLDLSGLWRRRQVRAVIDQVRSRAPMPTVLMGDLNEWSLNGGCMREFDDGHHVVPLGRSYHSRRPVGCLDRIILTPDLHLVASGVHSSERARLASDHLPVWAKVNWTD
ncbi:MAG: endonuclease/exonuclease/phosphatase family protein [Pseudomonadota bacterium]|uniref:endonuclease/exonuclease/phosphatase family protein n=1 Tax=Rhizorhabdus phycosphaerae TaxID=2711156 RepID=UPI0013EBCADA|nr:endonuclease/exonuclease/phosphatase family protein [Rhizorhabdus phycosphaerae]